MLTLEDLKKELASIKIAHDAVKKQLIFERANLVADEKTLYEIEGKLSLLRVLIRKQTPAVPDISEKRFKRGPKHSRRIAS